MQEKVNLYQKVNTLGNSQLNLIIQVYDGAISSFKKAADAFGQDDMAAGREHLEKAKRFVTHLYTTLDMEKGQEISEKLSKLYAFIINQTIIVEATKDIKQLDDNIAILNNLRLGWIGLKQQQAENNNNETIQGEGNTDLFSTSV